MRRIRYVAPEGVEPPASPAVGEPRVRDTLLAENVRIPIALNRLEAYTKSMGPGAIDINEAISLSQARFPGLLPESVRDVVTETAYAMLLKTAKAKGHNRALAVGQPWTNEKRTALQEWLTGRFEDLEFADTNAIVVTEMGPYEGGGI